MDAFVVDVESAFVVEMDPPFVFLPLANHCTYPQYNCSWHPFKEQEGSEEERSGDTDQRSTSSGVSGDSSPSSSGALSEWAAPSYPELATPRRPSPFLHVVVQSPQPPSWTCIEHSSPRKRLAARRLQGGDAKRASWTSPQGLHEYHSSAESRREAATEGRDREEAQQRPLRRGLSRSSSSSPGEIPRLSLRAREGVSSPSSTVQEPPVTPVHSPASCPTVLRRTQSSNRCPSFSSWTPTAPSKDFDAFFMGPAPSPRNRRYRLHCGGSPISASMSSTDGLSRQSAGCCALCQEALDLNRALYRSHCGELCHLQCARAERCRQHGPCPLCGQPADRQTSSPCFQSH